MWLSKHVEDCTRLVGPLRSIVNKHPRKVKADISHEWVYNAEAMNAFNAVKVALHLMPTSWFTMLISMEQLATWESTW